MNTARTFLAHNWFNLTTFILMLCGAVYHVGFFRRDLEAQQEKTENNLRTIERNATHILENLKADIADLRRQGIEKAVVIATMQKDTDRLEWDRDYLKTSLDDIKLNVKAIENRTVTIEQTMAVILEILKPKLK